MLKENMMIELMYMINAQKEQIGIFFISQANYT